ncbi:MAG: hypothetical protein R3C18_22900 [Planctomycetaceae bacterium]
MRDHRDEVERILQCFEQGGSCVLWGDPSARASVVQQVRHVVDSAGVRTVSLNLGGVGTSELPALVAVECGLVLTSNNSPVSTWLELTEYFQGGRNSDLKYVFLWDLQYCGSELVPVLNRLLSLTAGMSVHLFGVGATEASGWADFMSRPEFTVVRLNKCENVSDDSEAAWKWSRQVVPVQ